MAMAEMLNQGTQGRAQIPPEMSTEGHCVFVFAWGTSSQSLGIAADDQDPFDRDEAAFHRKLPELKRTHSGKYVAIYNGEVAGHGDSANDVAREFFRDHPQADAYIGFVGVEPPARQIKPASR